MKFLNFGLTQINPEHIVEMNVELKEISKKLSDGDIYYVEVILGLSNGGTYTAVSLADLREVVGSLFVNSDSFRGSDAKSLPYYYNKYNEYITTVDENTKES